MDMTRSPNRQPAGTPSGGQFAPSTSPECDSELVAPFTVVSVVDTRTYVEEDDRFVPVAGSGDPHNCDRCGRRHEVHANIVDATGQGGVVGVGCMDATTSEARRLSTVAAREAKERARAQAASEAAAELERIARDLPPFEAERIEHGIVPDGEPFAGRPYWLLGEARCWGWGDEAPDDPERLACLADAWTRLCAIELAGGRSALERLERLAGRRFESG